MNWCWKCHNTWVRRAMEGAATLAVPLRVSIGYGRHWDEAHA